MSRHSQGRPRTGLLAILPKRGVAYPRSGVSMVPFYIFYLIPIDSLPGGHGLAP